MHKSKYNTLFLILLLILSLSLVVLTAEAQIPLKIEVKGVAGKLKENVLAYLTIYQERDSPYLSEYRLQRLHEQSPKEIRSALQPFGYYKPTIHSDLVQKNGGWYAYYQINLGPQVKVKDITITIKGNGADDPQFQEFIKKFPIKKGSTLSHAQYEETKKRLYSIANERGYFDAKLIEHEIRINLKENSASIILSFDTGERYRFGEVTFKQDILDPDYLKKFIPFKRGAPYIISKLSELQNSLNNSEYFSSVEIQPYPDKAKDFKVPIVVDLEPLERQRFSLGIGYGTDTGARASLGWKVRRLNQLGHKLDTEANISEISQDITTHYIIPIADPATDYLAFNAGWSREDYASRRSDKYLLGTSYNHSFDKWLETFYLNYEQEKFRIGEDNGRSTLVLPGAKWSWVSTKNITYTYHGSRLDFRIKGTDMAIGSDTSFLQSRLQLKFIQGLEGIGRVILRGEIGSSLIDKFSELPLSQRFFTGGDQSVRGYAYKSLGPKDAQGTVLGGKYLLVGSIEYEQNIYGDWSAAIFYDTGNTMNNFSTALENGAGFGIRWKSPVGLIRLDLANALSVPDHPWRLHLVLGSIL
ncbi:MAG: autotransporter assembly complex family protein [bacterium]